MSPLEPPVTKVSTKAGVSSEAGWIPRGAFADRVRLGAYEVAAFLGAGGMVEVYRARDERLKREVALKMVTETLSSDPDRCHSPTIGHGDKEGGEDAMNSNFVREVFNG